jgi:hypothetical protein
MPVSGAKAAMARAYASGQKPKLIEVSPSGDNELWSLDRVLFLLPVIPPGASPELEYALRLRRDASLAGCCDQCGATFTIDSVAGQEDPDVSAAFFPHRSNCLAADDNIIPLLEEHYNKHHSDDTEEILQAASRRTKEKLRDSLRDRRVDIRVTEELQARMEKVLDDKLAATAGRFCGHLKYNSAQTWNICLWDDFWRCDECHLRFAMTVQAGAFRLSADEEDTCDFCRRFAPMSLQPTVVRINLWVLYCAACRRCAKELGDAGLNVEAKK